MSYDLATVRGSPVYTASPKFGADALSSGVVSATGADSFLSSTGANGGNLNTGTVEGWIKLASPPAATKVWSGHSGWFWLGVNSSGQAIGFYGGTNKALTSSTNICDGSWHHVALVVTSGAGAALYVDGNRVGTNAATDTVISSLEVGGGFELGGFGAAGGASNLDQFDWTGSIDEVRLSNVARYTGATYTTPTAAWTVDVSTVALWHLDGDGSNSVPPPAPAVTIGPDDANLIYSPYNWHVNSTRGKTVNPGAYVRALFDGSPTSILATFDVSGLTTMPTIKYRVDDGPWTQATLASSVQLNIPGTNDWHTHYVEVVLRNIDFNSDRWNTDGKSVRFTGFGLDAGTTRAIRSRALLGLCYGDSITEGLHTVTVPSALPGCDALEGYAHMLTDAVGAEIGVVGFGGTGLDSTYASIPVFGTTYSSLFSGQARAFTTPREPDFITILHGTNDGSGSAGWQGKYTTVLDALLAATTSTRIFAIRPLNGTALATKIQAAVAACSNPSRVFYVDTAGWWTAATDGTDSLHPAGFSNRTNLAPRFAAAIRGNLGGRHIYIRNADGTAKPVSPAVV